MHKRKDYFSSPVSIDYNLFSRARSPAHMEVNVDKVKGRLRPFSLPHENLFDPTKYVFNKFT